MNQTMEIYMARKKRVPGHYNPDSYRIFDHEICDDSLGDSRMNKAHIERKKEPPPPHPRERDRRNCPHPWHSRFLRNNVRFLNEPICVMATSDTDVEQNEWWPSRTSEEPLHMPDVTNNTTQRVDFKDHQMRKGNMRHSSNPLIHPSKGILPVNIPKHKDDPGDVLLEKISYSHNYNSRLNPGEPIRGKLHGSFVWDKLIKDPSGKPVIESPWTRRDIAKSGAVIPVNKNKENQPKSEEVSKTQIDKTSSSIPPIDGLPPA